MALTHNHNETVVSDRRIARALSPKLIAATLAVAAAVAIPTAFASPASGAQKNDTRYASPSATADPCPVWSC